MYTPPGPDIVFTALASAWFDLLADGGDAADLAAGPGGGNGGGAPPVLDVLASVELSSSSTFGPHMPCPLLEPTHVECLHSGLVGRGGGLGVRRPHAEMAAADAAAGAGSADTRLCRAEWIHMMHGCREAFGQRLFLRKAALATGPGRVSLLGHLLLGKHRPHVNSQGCGGSSSSSSSACHRGIDASSNNSNGDASKPAALALLQSCMGQRSKERNDVHAFLRRTLPDGEAIASSRALEELLLSSEGCVDRIASPTLPSVPGAPVLSAAVPWTVPDLICGANTLAGLLPPPCLESSPVLSATDSSPVIGSELPPPAMMSCLGDRVGADCPEGLLMEPLEDTSRNWKCCICLEDMPKCRLRSCGRLTCGTNVYCLDCLRQHAEVVVQGGLYSAPSVKCPSCNGRLATAAWSDLVCEKTLTKYRENARALLTFRCAACDETSSYFAPGSSTRDPFASVEPDLRDYFFEAWRRFFIGEDSAEDFLQSVLDQYVCGRRTGGTPPAKLNKILSMSGSALWISDIERRLAIQLAWMHRFPRQRTPCCGERFCFRCKISSWHRGVTCLERLQSEKAKQAQFCPGCGVPTQRSEGCRKITCVCGRAWDWEGDEHDEDLGFSDDDSDEDDASQAQTAVNLMVMNTKAKEDTVSKVIEALVNARADLNQTQGTTLEFPAPLLVAVQFRHSAAVTALADHGANVTLDVLEQVKLISHETNRRRIEDILRPRIQSDSNMKLPLWVWVQNGSAPAVEALLRNAAHEEVIGVDVMTALQRSCGDKESQQRMVDDVREHVGHDRFQQLEVQAATRRLLLELRQACDEERDADLSIVQHVLSIGADANACGDVNVAGDHADRSFGFTPLSLLAMNTGGSATSITSCIEALLAANADVNIESDEASTPLMVAVQHRNVAAIGALCKGPVKFVVDMLDEVKTMSETSKRHEVEDLLSPVMRANKSRRLPLWTWVEEGSAPAVKALLQGATRQDQQVDIDTLVALHRCRGDVSSRNNIEESLRVHVGHEEFKSLQVAAATRCLLQELREAYNDQRDICLETVRAMVAVGADANAREADSDEFEGDLGAYTLTVLQLLTTNTHASRERMLTAVTALVDAKADVNIEVNESALLAAVQHHCIFGIEALSRHGAKVTTDVLEELKAISGNKARMQIEDILQPIIDEDKSLRCPLWLWVQIGRAAAVEALLRNAAHHEEVDADVFVALQRCRGDKLVRTQLADRLQEYVGDEEFMRLSVVAATRCLLLELREAHGEERDPDLEIVCDALARGANPNAREESMDDAEEEEEEEEDIGEEADEEVEDDDEEEEMEGDDEEEMEEEPEEELS